MLTDQRRHRGFTLVEMIIAITLLGILATVAVPLLQMPMTAYAESSARARVTADMDWVQTKLGSDLATALPNSLRVRQVGTRYFIEFLQMHGHGRYRTGDSGVGQTCTNTSATCNVTQGDAFAFGPAATCPEACFFSLGRITQVGNIPPIPGSDLIVVNPGSAAGMSGDPYANDVPPAVQSIRSLMLGNVYNVAQRGHQITMTPHAFPALPPPVPVESTRANRFYIIASSPVTYTCDTTTGTLTRYWNYNIAPAQPTVFGAGVQSAVLSTRVACAIALPASVIEPAGVRGRGGLLSLKMIFAAPVNNGSVPEQAELVFTAPMNDG